MPVPKSKIPSFNEVMSDKPPIPSFRDVMGEKKNGGVEPLTTLPQSISQSKLAEDKTVQQGGLSNSVNSANVLTDPSEIGKIPSATIVTPDGEPLHIPVAFGVDVKGIQSRINAGIASQADINTISQATGKSHTVISAYLKSKDLGKATDITESRNNTKQQFISHIQEASRVYGTKFNADEILSSPDKSSQFMQQLKTINDNTKNSDIDENDIPDTLDQGKLDTLKDILSDNVRKLTADEGLKKGLTPEQTADILFQRLKPEDYAKSQEMRQPKSLLRKVVTSFNPIGLASNLTDWAQNTEQKNKEALAGEKSEYLLEANRGLHDLALEKKAEGVTTGNQALIDEANSIIPKIKDEKEIVESSPLLMKQQMADYVNQRFSKEAGIIDGTEPKDLNGRLLNAFGVNSKVARRYLKEGGYLDNPVYKDLANEVADNPNTYLADNSAFGRAGVSFLKPFVSIFNTAADLVGARSATDRHVENIMQQTFPEQLTQDVKEDISFDVAGHHFGTTISNTINSTANLAGYAAIAAATGGIGAEAGLAASTAERMGAWGSFGMDAVDSGLKEADKMGLTPAQSWLYAGMKGAMMAEGGRLFEFGKIAIPTIKGVNEQLVKAVIGISDKTITKDAAKELLDGTTKSWVTGLQKYGISTAKGAGVMAGFGIGDTLLKIGFGDENAKPEDILPEAANAFFNGLFTMGIMGGMGIKGNIENAKNSTYKGMLSKIVDNHDAAASVLKTGLDQGLYTPEEYNQKMQILNTGLQAKATLNDVLAKQGVKLTPEQKSVWVANKTAEQLLRSEAEKKNVTEAEAKTYTEQADNLLKQSTDVLHGLTFNKFLEPQYDLHNANLEHKQALADYSANQTPENEQVLLDKKQALDNIKFPSPININTNENGQKNGSNEGISTQNIQNEDGQSGNQIPGQPIPDTQTQVVNQGVAGNAPLLQPTDEEFKNGIVPTSSVDAEQRFNNGERIFGFDEKDGTPYEITSVEVLNKHTPDQLIALPKLEEKQPSSSTVEGNIPEFVAKSDKYFEYVPISEIENYKEHDREIVPKNDLNKLEEDIKMNGIQKPIQLKVDRNGNALIVEGNTRLAVAKRLGIKNIPVIVIEGEHGSINKEKAVRLPDVGHSEILDRIKNSNVKELKGAYIKGFTKVEPSSQKSSSTTVIQPKDNNAPNVVEPIQSPIKVIQPKENTKPNVIENIADVEDKNRVTQGVIGKVGNFVSRLFGGKAQEKVYIARNEKALTDKAEEIRKGGGKVSFQAVNDKTEAFYSPVEKFVQNNKQNTFTPEQVLGQIKNLPQNEIDAIGLKDFLKGKTKVTKQELLDYIAENKVNVEVVEKGDVKYSTEAKAIKLKHDKAVRIQTEIQDKLGGSRVFKSGTFDRWVYKKQFDPLKPLESEKIVNVPEEYIEKLDKSQIDIDAWDGYNKNKGGNPNNETKYGQYTLPGEKSNYREVLLTIGENEVDRKRVGKIKDEITQAEDKVNAAIKVLDGEAKEMFNESRWGDLNHNEQMEVQFKYYRQKDSPYEKYREAVSELDKLEQKEDNKDSFHSSHFNEPNIIAHIRLTDRTTPDGKRILFVEESQSDWAREGRKRGFEDKAFKDKEAKLKNQLKNLSNQIDAAKSAIKEKYGDIKESGIISQEENDHLQLLLDTKRATENELYKMPQDPVADLPFKNDKWVELSTKKAIQIAATEGYDGIAWINGEQTKDRYDLSKTIQKITYSPNEDGTYAISSTTGRNIAHENEGATIEEIEKTYGKEIADKVKNNFGDKEKEEIQYRKKDGTNPFYNPKIRIIQGDGLKIGGKWANNLYDKQIPKLAEKYAKQYGGKVGDVEIKTGQTKIVDSKGGIDGYFNTKEEAEKSLQQLSLRKNTDGWRIVEADYSKQFGIEITPDMKAKTESLPMFMRDKDGKVLGFTTNGKIYLNGEHINPNTPIHEAGHIWVQYAKQSLPEVHQRGMELTENSKYLKDVKENKFYQEEAAKLPKKERDDYFKEEALAQAIGDKGEQFVSESRKKGFKEWLTNLWTNIKEAAGFKDISPKELQNLTFDEFTKRAAKDILDENSLNTNKNETGNQEGNSTGQNQGVKNNTPEPTEKEAKTILERYRQVAKNTDLTDPYDKVLQYFAEGGRIHPEEIERILDSKAERTARQTMTAFNAPTISDLAHDFWESDKEGTHDDTVYANAIEDVLRDYTSKVKMQQDFLEKYDFESAAEKYYTGQGDPESKEAAFIVSGMTDEEVNHVLQMDAENASAEEIANYIDALRKKRLPPNANPDGSIGDGTVLSFRGLQEVADEFGLGTVSSRERKSDSKLLQDVENTISKWTKEGTYNKNVEKLVKAAEDKEVLNDEQRVIVQQHLANIRAEANTARKNFGVNSPEFNEKLVELKRVQAAGNATRSAAGAALRIADIASLPRYDVPDDIMVAKMEVLNVNELTQKQKDEAVELSKKVKSLSSEVESLKKKLSDALDKMVVDDSKPENIKQKAKKIADKIRSGKLSRPDTFSSATPASLVWDGALETAAKTIEGLGTVAKAVGDGIEYIKNSEWYKGLSNDKQSDAENVFKDFFNDKVKNEDLLTRFVEKKDNKFLPDEAKQIWDYAKKEYLDKGRSYYDMIGGVSMDLGLTPEQIRYALETPKNARIITNEMYAKQIERDKAIQRAKIWIKTSKTPKIVKILKAVPSFFFEKAIFGHGTVGMVTHAGMNIFRPSAWGTYIPNFLRQFKFAFGGLTKSGSIAYEKAMEDLTFRKNYILAKRSGLANDPHSVYDDYQGLKKFFGRLGVAGDRGFNALKVYRQDLFDSIYDKASEVEKSDPEYSKTIAKLVNHSTGTSKIPVPEGIGTAFFAPRLEASRWSRLILQPAKVITTLTNWSNATPAEKAAVKIVSKRTGEMLATYVGLLTANAAILSLTGSKQKINFTNPTDSDWLKFKAGGATFDVSGGMVSTMGFLGKLIQVMRGAKTELKGDKKSQAMFRDTGKYLRGKLSPFASTTFDFITHHDYGGNTLPGFKDKPDTKFAHKMTWAEYIEQRQLPIPISEAFTDVAKQMEDKGMSKVQVSNVLHGIFVGAVSGGTGARVSEDYKVK